MLLKLAAFEWRTALRMPSTYVTFALYTLLGAVWTLAYMGPVPGMSITMGSEMLRVDSPYVLSQVLAVAGLFGIFTVGSVMGRAGIKDTLYRMDDLTACKPTPPTTALMARFVGAYGVLVLVFAGLPLGAWAAVHSGLPAPDQVGAGSLRAYLGPMLHGIWPNLFVGGAFFFMLTTLTRRMTAVYVGSAVVLLGWLIASGLAAGADASDAARYALLDPSGILAADRETLYWSVAEKNTHLPALTGYLLWNRLAWSGFAVVCLAAALRLRSAAARRAAPRHAETTARDAAPTRSEAVRPTLRPVTPNPNRRTVWTMWRRLAALELTATVRNRYFAAILVCGVLFMVSSAADLGTLMGGRTFPVTYRVLDEVGSGFGLFVLVMIAFYAGEMVHRERDVRIDELYDALPLPRMLPIAAKATALACLIPALLSVIFFSGVALQLARGWTALNLPLYAVDLLVMRGTHLLMVAVLALFVHVTVNHKALAHLTVMLYGLLAMAAPRLGWNNPLLLFASAPPAPWSDMNGFGAALRPHLAYLLYWALFCIIPLTLAAAWRCRGKDRGLRRRLHLSPRARRLVGCTAALWAAYGAYLYQAGRGDTAPVGRHTRLQQAADLERAYGAYRHTPGFSIDAADYRLDLFAAEGRLEAAGTYVLTNHQAVPLDRIVLHAGRVSWSQPPTPAAAHTREVFDPNQGFFVFHLNRPLPPGGTTTLDFAYTYRRPGLPAYKDDTRLYRNGTFLDPSFFPSTGFPEDRLLKGDPLRKRFHLPPAAPLPDPDDAAARQVSGMGDTTWTALRAIVSTDGDQLPMVPAPLRSTTLKGGRRVAVFDTLGEKVLFFPTLVSARYAVLRDQAQGVDLEIYYHPDHHRNLDRMMDGLKDTLAYCTTAFGPYPLNYLRILEFPRHARFAQSLTGTIPFSEALGFIADVGADDPRDIDYPYFVTAHETAHQWWPHQVMPAHAAGANMLSETLAQYTALKVMEAKFGREGMRPMLRLQRHLYLKERGVLDHEEPPLVRVDEEHFIYYFKGGLALYALADAIGDDRVNGALAAYLAAYGGRPDVFPTTTDFTNMLREATPPRYHYLITDFFEQIVFHDLRLQAAAARPQADGGAAVTVTLSAAKRRAHGLGEETEVPMEDALTLGFYDAAGGLIATQNIWATSGTQTHTFQLDAVPDTVVADPYIACLDRLLDDNLLSITRE